MPSCSVVNVCAAHFRSPGFDSLLQKEGEALPIFTDTSIVRSLPNPHKISHALLPNPENLHAA